MKCLAMKFVAADVSPLYLIQSNVRADSRRLLRFGGSKRETSFWGILSLMLLLFLAVPGHAQLPP